MSQEIHQHGIPTRERCGLCGETSAVGFHVPNDVWAAVAHVSRRQDIHCIRCFTIRADEKLIAWDKEIEFYPISLRTHLEVVRRLDLEEALSE